MTEIETVSALRVALWEAGFRPIPVLNPVLGDKNSGKAPLGREWNIEAQNNPPFCVLNAAVQHALNTGIWAAGLRIVDFDLDDALLSTKCREIAYRMLGPAPLRERFGSSRFLLVYRAAEGEPGSISITGASHTTEHACKIEVLGTGRQFVAFGSHWSGVDLIWSGGTPGEVSVHDLPVISETQLMRFLEACAAVIGAKSPGATRTERVTPGGNGQDHASSDLFADPIRVAGALDGIANNEPADWEWWNRVGMAVWGATQGSAEGWAAFNAWSARNPAYHAARTRARWDHYATSPPDRIGAGTLFHLAAQGGRASSLFGDMNDINVMSPMSPGPPPPPEAREQRENGEDPAGTTWEGDTAEEGEEAPPPPPSNALGMLVERFNQKYAVVQEGDDVRVMWSVHDPVLKRDRLTRASFEAFKQRYMSDRLTLHIMKRGRLEAVTKTFATWWLENPRRRQYRDGVIFDPSGKAGPGFLNLWKGWEVKPAAGDWSLMSTHIHEVICAGRSDISSYVLRWLAHMLQFPGQQAEVAIVMRGEKGSGKGVLGNAILQLCGQHGRHIINAKHLVGQFTGHLLDVVFVFADEALFAGDKQHEGVLKGVVTEGTILIEVKKQTPVMAANVLHLLMSSNNDWVIPVTHDERRYLVLDVASTYRKNTAYFDALHAELANGGLAAMMHDLMAMDLTGFHPRQVPVTAELADQAAHSLTSQERWWHAVLDRGFVWQSRYGHVDFLEWQPFVTRELLAQSYSQWCQANRIHYAASRKQINDMLAKVYTSVRHREPHIVYEVTSVSENESPVVRKDWQRGYELGSIEEARERFGLPAEPGTNQDDF